MVMISKGETAAGNVGRVAARVVKRLRPTVDPDAWAAAVVRFQKESSSGLLSRMAGRPRRCSGSSWSTRSWWSSACGSSASPVRTSATWRCSPPCSRLYPLTIFPFAGLGVLDASLIVLINAEGVADPADLVAALVIWRAATLLLPLLPGPGHPWPWRRRQAGAQTEM